MGPIAGPAQRGPGEVDTCEGAAKGHGEGPPRTLQHEINEIQAESIDPTADRHLPGKASGFPGGGPRCGQVPTLVLRPVCSTLRSFP